jgi:hypothetical protein
MLHHGTIRKYTSALMDLFNGFEIQYEDSNGVTISRNIPIKYSSREKSRIIDDHTAEQLLSGNTNVLPRGSIAISTMVKSDQRVQNKNMKIATIKTDDTFEYMYNSVPYEFTFELVFQCRGMNEATMIIEQIAPKFNPIVNIDVWDVGNLDEPTRVPVKLLDIGIEQEEYEELSTNIVSINVGLGITGNLYPPVKTVSQVKELKMYINQQDGNFFARKAILGWDVDSDGLATNEEITETEDVTTYAPNVISINSVDVVGVGSNNITVIYDDKDNKLQELTFTWSVLSGSATVFGDLDTAQLAISSTGDVEVQVIITDIYGNYNSLSRIFTV